jgi:hypothetical protein
MNDNELKRRMDELRDGLELNSELIWMLNTHAAICSAQQQTLLWLLQEIQVKDEAERANLKKRCDEQFAKFLVAEQKKNESALSSADKTRPPSSSGSDAAKN